MADVEIVKETLALTLKCKIDAPRRIVWRCWTEPELVMQWYCPMPWRVTKVDQDFRVGGRNVGVMEGPNGARVDWQGTFLEVEPETNITFIVTNTGNTVLTNITVTDAFTEGFIPTAEPFMTGFVKLEDANSNQTKKTWGARHATEEATKKHLEMGFEGGWTAASEQLNELAKSLAKAR